MLIVSPIFGEYARVLQMACIEIDYLHLIKAQFYMDPALFRKALQQVEAAVLSNPNNSTILSQWV